MTSMMVGFLAGNIVDIDVGGLCQSVLWVVLGPVIMGVIIKGFFPKLADLAQHFTPLVRCVRARFRSDSLTISRP